MLSKWSKPGRRRISNSAVDVQRTCTLLVGYKMTLGSIDDGGDMQKKRIWLLLEVDEKLKLCDEDLKQLRLRKLGL